MEIEHIIGEANIPKVLQALPNNRSITAAGGCLVAGNLSNPHEQTFLHATDGPISSLRVSRSGQLIVSGHCGRNADVVVWDANTLQLRMTFHEHERAVVDCDVVDDDTMIVSIGAEKRLCFVDVSNGALIAYLPLAGHIPDHSYGSPSVHLAAGPRVQDLKRRSTNKFHTCIVTPQSILLLHVDPYQGQVMFNIQPPQMRVQLSSFLKTYTTSQFTAFGDMLVLGADSGEIALINTDNGAVLQTIRACSLGVRSLTVVSNGDMGNDPAQQENNFRYANFGPGSQRTSTIYVGGGDGSVVCVRLPSHLQPNQLTVASKTSVGEPISTISITDADATPPLLLVAAASGTTYQVAVLDTQPKQPEHDMYRRNNRDEGSAFGSTSASQRSNFRNTDNGMLPNATMGSGAHLGSPGNGSSLATNVKKISDAVRAPFTAIVAHPIDPARFVTASLDGMLREWDLNTYLCRAIFEADTTTGTMNKGNNTVSGNPSSRTLAPKQCTAMRISESLDLLLSAWTDGCVRCHDLTNHKLLWAHHQAHRVAVTSICATASFKYYVTGGEDGEVKMWDTKTRELRGSSNAHQQAVVHIEFFEGEQHLLTASKDRTVCTWEMGANLSTLRRVTFHQTHLGPLMGCKLSRNQQYFYSIGVDRKIHMCDLRNPAEPVKVADYSNVPHGRALNGGTESSVGSSEAEHHTASMLRSLMGSKDSYPMCFAFTNDERFVVTGGSDMVVRVWDTNTLHEPLAMAAGHSGGVTDITFTCDQKQIISCSSDATIVVWNCYL